MMTFKIFNERVGEQLTPVVSMNCKNCGSVTRLNELLEEEKD